MAKKKVKEPEVLDTSKTGTIDLTKSIITGDDIKFKIIWSVEVCALQNFKYLSCSKKDVYAYLRDDEMVCIGFEDNTNTDFDKDIILYSSETNLDEFILRRNKDISSFFAIYLTYQDYLDNKAVYVKGE